MATAKNKAKTTPKAKGKAKATKSTQKIRALKGQENHFYKGFPRWAAFELLLAAKKQTMLVSTFLDKVEALDNVKSRKQAKGIVQKLVKKPGDDGKRNGQIAVFC